MNLVFDVVQDGFKAEWKYTTTDAGLKTFRVEVYNKTTSELVCVMNAPVLSAETHWNWCCKLMTATSAAGL